MFEQAGVIAERLTPVPVEPPPDTPEAAGIDPVDIAGAARLECHQFGFPQDVQMLGDRRLGYRQPVSQLAHRHRPTCKGLDDMAAGRIGECLECQIVISHYLSLVATYHFLSTGIVLPRIRLAM